MERNGIVLTHQVIAKTLVHYAPGQLGQDFHVLGDTVGFTNGQ